MALTRQVLDQMHCMTPGCECSNDLYFHGKCHPGSPTFAVYRHGVVVIECALCEKTVAEIEVAEAPDGNS